MGVTMIKIGELLLPEKGPVFTGERMEGYRAGSTSRWQIAIGNWTEFVA